MMIRNHQLENRSSWPVRAKKVHRYPRTPDSPAIISLEQDAQAGSIRVATVGPGWAEVTVTPAQTSPSVSAPRRNHRDRDSVPRPPPLPLQPPPPPQRTCSQIGRRQCRHRSERRTTLSESAADGRRQTTPGREGRGGRRQRRRPGRRRIPGEMRSHPRASIGEWSRRADRLGLDSCGGGGSDPPPHPHLPPSSCCCCCCCRRRDGNVIQAVGSIMRRGSCLGLGQDRKVGTAAGRVCDGRRDGMRAPSNEARLPPLPPAAATACWSVIARYGPGAGLLMRGVARVIAAETG
jgi:hypothetical protein